MFGCPSIVVRDGKGAKDRVTMLPASGVEGLQEHLKWRRNLFNEDKRQGKASVYLPRMAPHPGPLPASGARE